MGFFKKVAKAVSKPVASAVKSTVKNAVPLTAAYFTGGASLSMMKPSGGLFDKAFGAIGMGQPAGEGQSVEQIATNYVQEKATNEANRFVNKQVGKVANHFTPKQNISSKKINSSSPSASKPFTQSISESFDSVSNAVGGKSKLGLIVGGVIAMMAVFYLISRGKK